MAKVKLTIWLDRNDPPCATKTQNSATSTTGPIAVAMWRFNVSLLLGKPEVHHEAVRPRCCVIIVTTLTGTRSANQRLAGIEGTMNAAEHPGEHEHFDNANPMPSPARLGPELSIVVPTFN